jgi:hypothetical protein
MISPCGMRGKSIGFADRPVVPAVPRRRGPVVARSGRKDRIGGPAGATTHRRNRPVGREAFRSVALGEMNLWSPDRNLETAATRQLISKETTKGPAGPEHERSECKAGPNVAVCPPTSQRVSLSAQRIRNSCTFARQCSPCCQRDQGSILLRSLGAEGACWSCRTRRMQRGRPSARKGRC